MQTLHKMSLVAALIFIAMIVVITNVVQSQTEELKKTQSKEISNFYNKNKDIELKNYFDLAKQSIAHLLGPDQLDDIAFKNALTILEHLSYGEEKGNGEGKELDGYFFLFSPEDGTFLMHPRQKDLVGKSFLRPVDEDNQRDRIRSAQLKKIVEHAIDKKNYVDYVWEKPSNPKAGFIQKRAYVEIVKGLGVLGTGTYLSDIEEALEIFNTEADRTIDGTMRLILLSSLISFGIMGAIVYWFIRDRNLVDKELAQVYRRNIVIQDRERSRISDQLHDSVKPFIIAARRKVEMAINTLRQQAIQDTGATAVDTKLINELEDSVSITNQAIQEIKREIYKNSSMDIELLNIEAALQSYISKVTSETLPINFSVSGKKKNELAYSVKEAFSLVVREAINNALSHSGAKEITVNLIFKSDETILQIIDNGQGFKESSLNQEQGLGLANMRNRIKIEGGDFNIETNDRGTKITAKIPVC